MPSKKKTIFFLVDGARYDVMKELIEANELPNIKNEILSRGTFRKATSCFPSTTGPAYLPHLMGCFPGTANIPGIRWFDKEEFKRKRINKYAMRSYCGPESVWFNSDMPSDRPTLHELLGNTYNIFSMITRNIPEERDLARKVKSKLYIKAHFLHKHHPVDVAAHEHLMLSLEKNPDFVFVVFPCVDWNSHAHHPRHEKTIQAYKYMDFSVGKTVEKLKATGEWSNTLFLLTSDHGLTQTHTHFDLANYFSQRGLRALQYPIIWKYRPKSAVMISGNSFGSVHLLNHKGSHVLRGTELIKTVGVDTWQDLVNQQAVDFIAWRGDSTEYWIESKEGKAKITKSMEGFTYHPISGDPFGFGILDQPMDEQEALAQTFETNYPDALVQIEQLFKSRRAGDLIVSAANGYDLRDTWEFPEHHGSHGSLHKDHINVPLLYNQIGWDERPARTTDVFNSILKWMGKPTLANTDGRSLC